MTASTLAHPASTPTLTGPAAALSAHAHHTAHLRSHRARIDEWLRELSLATVEQLFAAVGGQGARATAVLLTDHQRGVELATTILLGAKARMLSAVARHAPGDTREERFQATLEAYLTRALARVKPTHKYVDAQLYWVTLRTVTKLHERRTADVELSCDMTELERTMTGSDVVVEAERYLTADVLLGWALEKGFICEADCEALSVRFGGSKALPVREVAARLGVSENGLESRLRRAIERVRAGVVAQRDDLDRACVAARWSLSPDDGWPVAAAAARNRLAAAGNRVAA
jgi:hypothetical protein